MTVTTKLTVTEVPGSTKPSDIPVAGLTPGTGTLLMRTLFSINVEPDGIGSFRMMLADVLPVLFTCN